MLVHVTARGNNRQPIFLDDIDYVTFLRMLLEIQSRCAWLLHPYCLMPNHYHLVVEADVPLTTGLHHLNGRYALRFNQRHGRAGHVFEGPYDAKPIETDEHFTACCRYIAENPVRADLCGTPSEWPWSGGDTYDPHLGVQRLPPAYMQAAVSRWR